jgi:hypothetical protein
VEPLRHRPPDHPDPQGEAADAGGDRQVPARSPTTSPSPAAARSTRPSPRALDAQRRADAIDADIIKTYVALGLGIGIVAYMAFDPERTRTCARWTAAHLFESSTTRIGIRRNAWLRGYTYAFIELFAPHLTRKMVQAALAGEEGSDPGL